ncbi:hypothetical protein STAL104432_01135 [Streptomyces albus]
MALPWELTTISTGNSAAPSAPGCRRVHQPLLIQPTHATEDRPVSPRTWPSGNSHRCSGLEAGRLHQPPRPVARAPAPPAIPQEHRVDHGRYSGPHLRSHRRRGVEELPALDQPSGRHRRRHAPGRRRRPTGVRQPQRLHGWELSGAKAAGSKTTAIANGGYRGTNLVIPHRREHGQTELPAGREEHHASHRKTRARIEHAFPGTKTVSTRTIPHGRGEHNAPAPLDSCSLGCPGSYGTRWARAVRSSGGTGRRPRPQSARVLVPLVRHGRPELRLTSSLDSPPP